MFYSTCIDRTFSSCLLPCWFFFRSDSQLIFKSETLREILKWNIIKHTLFIFFLIEAIWLDHLIFDSNLSFILLIEVIGTPLKLRTLYSRHEKIVLFPVKYETTEYSVKLGWLNLFRAFLQYRKKMKHSSKELSLIPIKIKALPICSLWTARRLDICIKSNH